MKAYNRQGGGETQFVESQGAKQSWEVGAYQISVE